MGRSEDGTQAWLNWIVRRAADRAAMSFVQATVTDGCAEVAWVIGAEFQRQGWAHLAAALMIAQLRPSGVSTVVAHIHPDHYASAAVAVSLGLKSTGRIEGGEMRWEG